MTIKERDRFYLYNGKVSVEVVKKISHKDYLVEVLKGAGMVPSRPKHAFDDSNFRSYTSTRINPQFVYITKDKLKDKIDLPRKFYLSIDRVKKATREKLAMHLDSLGFYTLYTETVYKPSYRYLLFDGMQYRPVTSRPDNTKVMAWEINHTYDDIQLFDATANTSKKLKSKIFTPSSLREQINHVPKNSDVLAHYSQFGSSGKSRTPVQKRIDALVDDRVKGKYRKDNTGIISAEEYDELVNITGINPLTPSQRKKINQKRLDVLVADSIDHDGEIPNHKFLSFKEYKELMNTTGSGTTTTIKKKKANSQITSILDEEAIVLWSPDKDVEKEIIIPTFIGEDDDDLLNDFIF